VGVDEAIDPGIGWPVRHRAPVDVAHAGESAGPQDAHHLRERADRLAQVLKHLVRVGDVKARVGEGQRVHAGFLVLEVAEPARGGVVPRRRQRLP
jgi:hypothetical protein